MGTLSKQDEKKDAYLISGWLEFERYDNKLVAISTKPDEKFRAFAYICGSLDAAKTSILMEYRDKQLSNL